MIKRKEWMQLNVRRQSSFVGVGRKEDTLYSVEDFPDGTIVLSPASVVNKVSDQDRLDQETDLKTRLVDAYKDDTNRVPRKKLA